MDEFLNSFDDLRENVPFSLTLGIGRIDYYWKTNRWNSVEKLKNIVNCGATSQPIKY